MRHRITSQEKIIVLSLFMLCSAYVQAQDLSVIPNQGFQGETLTLKIIAYDYLVFVDPFDVQFSPSDGIEVGEVFFDANDDPNYTKKFNVTISIAANATLGNRTIFVTDAIDSYTGDAIFEVLCANCGTILNVNPNSGMVGKNLDVTVTGSQTHFYQNTSVLSFSASGITVDSVKVTQETVLTAHLTISASAALGTCDVTVKTGSKFATGSKLFEVTDVPPIELSKPSGMQGKTLTDVVVTGGPGGYLSSTPVSLGDEISIQGVTANGSTLTISTISIGIDEPIGPHDLILTTNGAKVTAKNAFIVLIGPATSVDSIIPDKADRGHPGFPVTVTGTHLRLDKVAGYIKLDGGTAYGINGTTVPPDQLKADLHIDDNTTERSYNVIVDLCPTSGTSQDCQSVSSSKTLFEVTKPGAVTVTDPVSAVIDAGKETTVKLNISECPLIPGNPTMQIEPAEGVTVTKFTVDDDTHATATILVNTAAFGSKRTLRVINGPDVAIGTQILKIFNPQIVAVVPAQVYQNTPSIKLTVYGNDLQFDAQSTISVSGDGVTVSNTTFDPLTPDQISCNLAIDATATTGKRDVTVTVGSNPPVKAVQIFSVLSPEKPYQHTTGCSCSVNQEDPLWLGWWVWLLVILWWRIKRPVLVR